VKPGDTGILFPTGQSPGQESAEPIATIEVLDVRTTRVVQTIIGDANTDFMDRPEGKIIGMLTPASVVEALSEQGMWTQIRYKNQTGFVRTEQILSQSIQEDRAICQITNMAQPIAPDADLGVSFDLEASPSP
jgi:hypothetical protein